VATFTFRVPAPPVSVGGVTEVYGSLASPGSASAWRDTIPLLALALLAFAGVAVGTRRWLAARRVR
jgi:hypothetical protein